MVFPVAGIASHTLPVAGSDEAVDYDGTNDFANRGAGLTGAVDAKTGTLSFWVRFDGGNAATHNIFNNTGLTFRAIRTGGDVFQVRGKSTSATVLLLTSNTTYTTADGWIHVIAAWDLATPEAHLFINDMEDEAAGATETDADIDYTVADWSTGAAVAGGGKLNGCLSEFYFEDTFVDITSTTERRKFITAAGKPEDLGADGSTPTGASPLIYAPDGDPSTNAGTGGAFVITGALSQCSDGPSD